MKEEDKKKGLPGLQDALEQEKWAESVSAEEEVLDEDALFDVQGGVENPEYKKYMQQECGLGCYMGGGGVSHEKPGQHI